MLQKTSNNIFFIVGNQTVIGAHTFTHALTNLNFTKKIFHQFCIAKLKAWVIQANIGDYSFTHAIEH